MFRLYIMIMMQLIYYLFDDKISHRSNVALAIIPSWGNRVHHFIRPPNFRRLVKYFLQ